MATIRHHIEIDRSPEEVWNLVGDSTAWTRWFPGLEKVVVDDDGKGRTITLGGFDVPEEIVTNDDGLRRFQYRMRPGGLPVQHHLGTIDVLPVGDRSLVVYSTDIEPEEMGAMIGDGTKAGLEALKAHVEG